MKNRILTGAAAFVVACLNASATIHYVNSGSANPIAPYTNWTSAAVNIQDAINVSVDGDLVLVTNGVYAGAGEVMAGGLTNRVALTSAITVQSVNGPWVTTIQGGGTNNSPSAVRCAWLTNNATLVGFTLTGGATVSGDNHGGGVWCADQSSVVENCAIISNTSQSYAGAVYQGTLNNCFISGNATSSASQSEPYIVYEAYLNSCTVVSNVGVAVYGGALTNCIVYYPIAENGPSANWFSLAGSAYVYTCTTPLPSAPPPVFTKGDFTTPPQLFADGVHLLSNSPCIGAGTNLVTGTDIFGKPWANPPSVGCAEFDPSPVITQPAIILTGDPRGFVINAVVGGSTPPSAFWLQNGVPLQDNGHFSFTQTTNLVVSGLSLADAADYQLVASNSFGVTTSAVAQLTIHCVDAAGTNPVAPYLTWATAATNIQDAIDVSVGGDIVLATNGLYAFGGESMDGLVTNRVTLNIPIRVQSVNGPWVTTIQGAGATNGPSAIRCAWLTTNAVLSGFTVEWGATAATGTRSISETGGGVWCASSSAIVDNCIIVSNTAYGDGFGVYQGTLNNCLVRGNTGTSGGALSTLSANNCTVISNSTRYAVTECNLTNCIVYYNALDNEIAAFSVAYCCTPTTWPGPGNFTAAPHLQADGVHLSSGSPCIGAGTNLVIGTDIFGMPWANPPAVGCAEYNAAPLSVPPQVTLTGEPVGFQIGNAAIGGQGPFAFQWLQNGVPLQDNSHFSSAQSSNLVAIGISLADAAGYQLVVSNAAGVSTSAVARLVIHTVDAAGINAQPPYTNWATAATSIQDAIDAAAPGEIVLVTNGVYASGGSSADGVSTNRVTLNKAVLLTSVNGSSNTVIAGAWDSVSTNGPAAVRCAWLTNGAELSGFALCNGATQNSGFGMTAGQGGGAWCASNALVANCVLSNNAAVYGGGISFGTLDNSLVVGNFATGGGGCFYATMNNCLVISNRAGSGGGAYDATLNNCTVEYNIATSVGLGAGTYSDPGPPGYSGYIRNSIVVNNNDAAFGNPDNYNTMNPPYLYCCTANSYFQAPPGSGNIIADPEFLDLYHISVNSPCRGAGSALYASGTDFDGEPWNNPPSMGCSEVAISNLIGPLSVTLTNYFSENPPQTNVLVTLAGAFPPHFVFFDGTITGRASLLAWNFGDGQTVTNAGYSTSHYYTNTGVYDVVLTAYNDDNPSGVSANVLIYVVPINSPQLQSVAVISNVVEFQFPGQVGANYALQYTTNLAPPVAWTTLGSYSDSAGQTYQVTDSVTNESRFYRVQAQ